MFVESFSTIVFLKSMFVSEGERILKYSPSFFFGVEQDDIFNDRNKAGMKSFFINEK